MLHTRIHTRKGASDYAFFINKNVGCFRAVFPRWRSQTACQFLCCDAKEGAPLHALGVQKKKADTTRARPCWRVRWLMRSPRLCTQTDCFFAAVITQYSITNCLWQTFVAAHNSEPQTQLRSPCGFCDRVKPRPQLKLLCPRPSAYAGVCCSAARIGFFSLVSVP